MLEIVCLFLFKVFTNHLVNVLRHRKQTTICIMKNIMFSWQSFPENVATFLWILNYIFQLSSAICNKHGYLGESIKLFATYSINKIRLGGFKNTSTMLISIGSICFSDAKHILQTKQLYVSLCIQWFFISAIRMFSGTKSL